MECIKDERVLKKLLVCAPEHGKQTAGGQHLRWSDIVTRDLKRYGLKKIGERRLMIVTHGGKTMPRQQKGLMQR